MSLILRLAWRNAWRNPRRTGIVVAAVSIGIAGVLLTISINYGMIVQMVETAISTELGHVQVHAEGFDADPELRVRLEDGGRAGVQVLEALPGVRAFARRVRAEGLISSPRASAGVRVVGIEPEREAMISLVAASMIEGRYLNGDSRRVLLGEQLGHRLDVELGEKVVISAQNLEGDLTGEALRVGGFFRTPSAELDRSTVFMHIEEGQALLGLGDAVSELVAVGTTRAEVPGIRQALAERLDGVEVRSWKELQPVLVYLVEVFDQMAFFIYAAVFIAMAFGIANVLLMTVFERTRELGIMTAVGFDRPRLVATIVAEGLVVTWVGVALGLGGALLGVWALSDGIELSYFAEGLHAYGIGTRIVPVLRPSDFASPVIVASVTACLASAWPALRAVRLQPAEAVRRV